MAMATTARPPDRHPWLAAFLADPASELDHLLSGHARIGPYESADAPDAARLLFGGLPEEDEARGVLDRALLEWLDSQRVGGIPELDRLPLERWIRKVSEAFEIVGLLMLPTSSLDFRQRFVVWNSWADRLAVAAQRDGRYTLWRTLALTQRRVAGAEPTANPFALEPLWLRICEQAGSSFPPHYLAVGLLGLRMLPEREGSPSERPWITGLGRWAMGQTPLVAEFSQQWWALKGLYPRMPSYWGRAIQETLRQSSTKEMPDELKDWWRQDVKVKDGTTAQQPQSQPVGVLEVPPLAPVTSLLRKTRNPLPSIRSEIETLVGIRRHYAEATGESHYLVTTACNIGMRIITGTDDPVGRGRLAVDLARQALAWQPADVFAWALWRDALAKQGAFEAAELVGWETIRCFPENEQWRNQLALLLGDLPGREADAEQLLRESIDRFPDKIVARNQFALLLGDLPGRETDAERLLRESIDRFPDDVVARNQLAELLIALDRADVAIGVVDGVFSRHLEDEASFDLRARLLYHSGDVEVARDTLQAGVERFPTNPILQNHLQMLDAGKPLSLKAAASRADAAKPKIPAARVAVTDDSVGMAVRQRGRLRRLFSEFRRRQGDGQWRGTALEEVQRILSEDPNLAYAEYLNRELEGSDRDGSVGGSFAIAFIDAVKQKDADRFARLEESFSSQAHLVDVAKAYLFGDRPAADRTLAWLMQDARSEPRSVSALRGFLHQRLDIPAIVDGGAFVKLVAANDNMETDLIESAFAGDELLLVA